MKTLLASLSLALIGGTVARAEIYRPSVVRNSAVVGAVAGALIGGHNNDRWAEGALIGAAAGAVVGAVVDQSRPVVYQRSHVIAPVAVVPSSPAWTSAPPAVVYASEPAPQVVYVESYPPPVIVTRPIVHLSTGWGPGYYGWRHHGYSHHRPHYRYGHSRNHLGNPHYRHGGPGHGWRGHDGHGRRDGQRHRR